MIKKVIKYVDFDGTEREEEFCFHLSRAEVMDMQLSTDGTLTRLIEKIVAEKNIPKIVEIFKKLILASYGEKSLDGRRFVKSEEATKAFTETEAYSVLYMELATDADAAVEFINGIVPADMTKQGPQDHKPKLEMTTEPISE